MQSGNHTRRVTCIAILEKVQSKAARFVTEDYSRESSFTQMKNIGWQCLLERRPISRLKLMYKLVHCRQFYNIVEEGTTRTVPGTLEQTKTATHHHFYHVRFQNGIIFLFKLELLHQLTRINLFKLLV